MTLVREPLIGEHVRLDPSTLGDAQGLIEAARSPETFGLFTRVPEPFDEPGMKRYLGQLIEDPTVEPLTLRENASGRVLGMTSYCDIRPAHRTLEIGWTFLAPDRRGTRANPEMKRLLLVRTFETDLFSPGERHPGGPALRVCLKTHHSNERSQRAIAKLGAVYEGTLRNHVVMPDGSSRHSVYFSITQEEWPAVRAGLGERLG